ncbi:phosphatidyl inositol kinase, partial [Ascosphaera acerosa]
ARPTSAGNGASGTAARGVLSRSASAAEGIGAPSSSYRDDDHGDELGVEGRRGRRDRDARYDQDAARGLLFNADDLEGDLGYAAAEELERRATRKVIVERLETVHSKNPVFTWC